MPHKNRRPGATPRCPPSQRFLIQVAAAEAETLPGDSIYDRYVTELTIVQSCLRAADLVAIRAVSNVCRQPGRSVRLECHTLFLAAMINHRNVNCRARCF
jgi:hypothetical protein